MVQFESDGFAILHGVVGEALGERLSAWLDGRGGDDVGVGARDLLAEPECRELAQALRADARLARVLPRAHVAVQCTSFEKSQARNWLVPIHQDLVIPVAERIEAPGLAGWSNKDGCWFVLPPVAVLEQLVAVRVHVDDCGLADGPLRVVPGSHLCGRIADDEAVGRRRAGPLVDCPVPRGGALVMRPLLLHASSKASGTSRRRVLHLLFGPAQLPHGLRWNASA